MKKALPLVEYKDALDDVLGRALKSYKHRVALESRVATTLRMAASRCFLFCATDNRASASRNDALLKALAEGR